MGWWVRSVRQVTGQRQVSPARQRSGVKGSGVRGHLVNRHWSLRRIEHAVRRRKSDVPVWLCEIWSIRGVARCAFWATFRPRFGPRDEAHAGVAIRNCASRRRVATSFLRRSKSDVTVLLCEICHTRGWGSKTRAAVALVEPREIIKNRGYDY